VSCTASNRLVSYGTLVQFITGNCYKSELHFTNIRVFSNELDMCARWLHDNSATRSTGAEVAGSANSAAQYA